MITIRQATPRELPAFAALEQNRETSEFITPESPAQHNAEFNKPDTVYLAIVDEKKRLGFIILVLDGDGVSVEFKRIVVSSKDEGIGQRAIAEMERFCAQTLKRQRIWLDVFEFNRRGRHIYRKLGYQQFDKKEYQGKMLLYYEKTL